MGGISSCRNRKKDPEGNGSENRYLVLYFVLDTRYQYVVPSIWFQGPDPEARCHHYSKLMITDPGNSDWTQGLTVSVRCITLEEIKFHFNSVLGNAAKSIC